MLPSMSIGRQCPAIAKFMGNIFVMGGRRGKQHLDSVECYDPLTNIWSSVAPLNEKRREARAGVSGGYLYIVGGINEIDRLSNIERYDNQSKTWTMVSVSKR